VGYTLAYHFLYYYFLLLRRYFCRYFKLLIIAVSGDGDIESGGKKLSGLEKKALTKLGVVTLVFCNDNCNIVGACHFFFLISLWINVAGRVSSPEWLVSLYSNLMLLNTAINPIIFYYMDPLIKANVDNMFGLNRK
jgi:hypothetical protein